MEFGNWCEVCQDRDRKQECKNCKLTKTTIMMPTYFSLGDE